MPTAVTILTQTPSDTTRSEQAPRAVANRAARTTSSCCYRTDGDKRGGSDSAGGAGERDRRGGAQPHLPQQRHGRHPRVVFINVDDSEATTGPVPPGAPAYVLLTCRIPPSPPKIIGGFSIPALDAERLLAGAATIDPSRSRRGAGILPQRRRGVVQAGDCHPRRLRLAADDLRWPNQTPLPPAVAHCLFCLAVAGKAPIW